MVDLEVLRNLVPLNTLPDGKLEAFAAKLVVEPLPKGSVICREGDTDDEAVYLVEGGAELTSHSTTLRRVVQGGTHEASYPLVRGRPRPYSVVATTDVKIIRIDDSRLDRVALLGELTTIITQIHITAAETLKGDHEWLEEMWVNRAFRALPREKLAPLVQALEPVFTNPGDVVFRQGDAVDHFHVVKEGRFTVSHKDAQGKVHILSELSPGSVFGHEALISGAPQGASIVSMSEGTLMRLARGDFEELLKRPLLAAVTAEQAQQMVKQGAQLLDVRARADYQQGALRGSINVPVTILPGRLRELDRQRRYIVCCNSGVQSEVAAFLMRQRGFDVYVLGGGLQSLPKAR